MKKKLILLIVIVSAQLLSTTALFATPTEDGELLAKQLRLVPGTKASIQWKRIFKNEHKRKRYKLDRLSDRELLALKRYLLEHAADSPKPIVPGL